ncbi:YSIRK-type signal peptide-containing protein, partial [Mammaliicoccus vitulinus]|uniref:YSIRK-type signal peptide-containing protein n=1 Tax=Mammaliicoccus vitulinus TaxID=71237 RepID=UPI003B983EAF
MNKYSIRKFTVGTASILVGATLLFGLSDEAKADESANSTSIQGESKNNNEVNQTEEPLSEQQSSLTEENSVESPTTEEVASTEEKATGANTTEKPSTEEKVNLVESVAKDIYNKKEITDKEKTELLKALPKDISNLTDNDVELSLIH